VGVGYKEIGYRQKGNAEQLMAQHLNIYKHEGIERGSGYS